MQDHTCQPLRDKNWCNLDETFYPIRHILPIFHAQIIAYSARYETTSTTRACLVWKTAKTDSDVSFTTERYQNTKMIIKIPLRIYSQNRRNRFTTTKARKIFLANFIRYYHGYSVTMKMLDHSTSPYCRTS